MRHRRVASRPRGDRLVAGASVVVMALSTALLLHTLDTHASQRVGQVDERAGGPPPTGRIRPTASASQTPAAAVDAAALSESLDLRPRVSATRWRAVLAVLDRRRSRAYARAAPRLLRAVYTAGSDVLRQDRALLLSYRDRGLRVRGLRVRVAAARAHRTGSGVAVLRVRDRVVAGTVVGAAGSRVLPPDAVDVHRVTLRQVGGGEWRISAVRPVRR